MPCAMFSHSSSALTRWSTSPASPAIKRPQAEKTEDGKPVCAQQHVIVNKLTFPVELHFNVLRVVYTAKARYAQQSQYSEWAPQ